MAAGILPALLPGWALLLLALGFCSQSDPYVIAYFSASLIATAVLFRGLWRSLFRAPQPPTGPDWNPAWSAVAWCVLAAAASVALAIGSGSRHDYGAYSDQWQTVLAGQDPWIGTDNAYGPVHNLLAVAYAIHPLLPKALFSLMAVGTAALAAHAPLGRPDPMPRPIRTRLFLACALSPFVLISVSVFGLNDVLPAAAMVLAIIAPVALPGSRTIRVLAGAALAAGTMAKIYPVIILPVMVIRRGRIDWYLAAGFLGASVAILLVAHQLWGGSLLEPLLYAGSRGARHLSFFSFSAKVLGLDLADLSLPLMAAAFLATSWQLLRLRVDPVFAAILLYAVVLSFYKLGHQQFFLFFFLITPFAIRHALATSRMFEPPVAGRYFLWLGLLNWYQLAYILTCSMWIYPAEILRHWAGLLYLSVSLPLLLAVCRRLRPVAGPGRSDLAQ